MKAMKGFLGVVVFTVVVIVVVVVVVVVIVVVVVAVVVSEFKSCFSIDLNLIKRK